MIVVDIYLFYGVLFYEVVCIENFIFFLKFLLCKGKVGIVILFDGYKLFDVLWQSMVIDVKFICFVGVECVLQIELIIDMVFDIDWFKWLRGMGFF